MEKNKYQILIAEDDLPSFELLEIYLENYNVSITHVDNGEDLVTLFYDKDFDLVITDNRMPLLSGIEVVKLVRQKDQSTPFIAISGNVFEEDKEACLQAGFNAYLNKPIKPQTLIDKMQIHLPELSK
jgi:CheY-like chemotaxis protein